VSPARDIRQLILTGSYAATPSLLQTLNGNACLKITPTGTSNITQLGTETDLFPAGENLVPNSSTEMVFVLAWFNDENTTVNVGLSTLTDLTISFE
jgi:hypothetical protein